jgi:homoserine kinase
MTKMKVKVPATTANLGPGFDTLGMALEIYNYIEVQTKDKGLDISIKGAGKDNLPVDKNNLIYQAMESVFLKADVSPPGLKLNFINRIPLARGLGSSAAAIVGGLTAANELIGEKFSTQQLLNLAMEFEQHPDNITPALLGGLVVSTLQEGEILYKKIAVPDIKVVVCIPDFELSTAKAREVLPEKVDFDDAVFNVSRTGLLLTGFLTQDYELVSKALDDRLHQCYRASLIPGFKDIVASLKDKVLGVTLSGAGPTVVAFTQRGQETAEIGQEMVDAFAAQEIRAQYLVTSPTNQGTAIIDSK